MDNDVMKERRYQIDKDAQRKGNTPKIYSKRKSRTNVG